MFWLSTIVESEVSSWKLSYSDVFCIQLSDNQVFSMPGVRLIMTFSRLARDQSGFLGLGVDPRYIFDIQLVVNQVFSGL